MSDNCEVCLARDQLDRLQARNARNRKQLGICWVNGGMINGTEETTVITIDCRISPEIQNKLLALLQAIESDPTTREERTWVSKKSERL